MELLDAVMLCMLVTLAGTSALAYRQGNEGRDVKLLLSLTGLWGAGTAMAVLS